MVVADKLHSFVKHLLDSETEVNKRLVKEISKLVLDRMWSSQLDVKVIRRLVKVLLT